MSHILIIEDEPTIATFIQEALGDEGHTTEVASCGADGLLHLQAGPPPDLVLLDLFMPMLDGRTVLEQMRADPRLVSVPVILMTGAVPGSQEFPNPAHYQATLTKPFSIDELIALVDDCLEACR